MTAEERGERVAKGILHGTIKASHYGIVDAVAAEVREAEQAVLRRFGIPPLLEMVKPPTTAMEKALRGQLVGEPPKTGQLMTMPSGFRVMDYTPPAVGDLEYEVPGAACGTTETKRVKAGGWKWVNDPRLGPCAQFPAPDGSASAWLMPANRVRVVDAADFAEVVLSGENEAFVAGMLSDADTPIIREG